MNDNTKKPQDEQLAELVERASSAETPASEPALEPVVAVAAPGTEPGAMDSDIQSSSSSDWLPVLALRNAVAFPNVVMPLAVGRPESLKAIEAALATEEKTIILLTQKHPEQESPDRDDLFEIGTKAVVRKMMHIGDVVQMLAQGVERVRVTDMNSDPGYLQARTEHVAVSEDDPTELDASRRAVNDLVGRMLELAHPERAEQLKSVIGAAENPLHFVYLLTSVLPTKFEQDQKLLEQTSPVAALQLMHEYLTEEIRVLELRKTISEKAESELSREHREFLLRRQMDAIREELGEASPEEADVDELRQRLDEIDLPDEVRKEAERELKRLERLPAHAPDYQLTRTWLELIVDLPWFQSTEDNIDLTHARNVLDEDHFDLQDVKDRIIEHLAVMRLNPDAHAPILCFVGPPGVGKTSLGQSIARAIGRKFERIALGGLHDESELRGHRRTYIGAMPGRLIQALRRAEVSNPLIMLDEVDKLGHDFHGDPASALLEILDPAQNHTFHDNYLDLPFDLSDVLFICTANTLDSIPRPLLDRMEVIRIPGYADEDKMQIARRYLIPRQLKENGISMELIEIPDDTLSRVITHHTREAGVRQLERAIGKLARKVAVRVAGGDTSLVRVRPEDLVEMLGHEVHRPERLREEMEPGVATGLAWTEAGGEVLFVESSLLPEGRGVRLTGQLGDVMKESAEAAHTWVWAHAEKLGINPKQFRRSGVHIHVPAGAVPKDGPSAGIAMVTALVSLYTDTPARNDTAMTGEITLSGHVLPIGGVKEKVLAARSAGIHRVVLPKANEDSIRDLPEHVRDEMEFHFVSHLNEALQYTLTSLFTGRTDTVLV